MALGHAAVPEPSPAPLKGDAGRSSFLRIGRWRANLVNSLKPSPQRSIVMTSQGTSHGRFQRAIQRGQLFHAELAARELGSLTLADALALTALIAKEDPARYGRAAVRWHGRFALEAKGLELVDSQLALAALASLPHDEKAALAVLFRLGGRHGVSGLDAR